MKSTVKTLLLAVAVVAFSPAFAQKATSARTAKARFALLDTYCTECHNTTEWAGGMAYDALTPADLVNDITLAEHTVRKLRGHLMPPPGSKQPTQAENDQLVSWLETSLDARKKTPRAQYVTAQRLNRTEYANAVRTLLAVDVKVEDLLPPDVELEGFDNIAAALTVSPAFLDQYISAARNIAMRATGQGAPKLIKATYGNANQAPGVTPPGANRGLRFRHFFPADGEYRVSILNDLGGANTHAVMFKSTIVMFLDGVEFFRGDVGGKEDLALFDLGASGAAKVMPRFRNIPVKAPYGYHEILVTTVERSQVLSDANTGGGIGANGANPSSIEVAGPYGPIGFSHGQSRDRVFICYANTEPEEKPCAEKIARNLATQAYRRPATDADVQRLMGFYATGRKDMNSFIGGVQEIVMAVISSPEFLYRTIQPKEDRKKRPQPLTALELASRLSFFLWSDVPDEELRGLAISGKLSDPVVYDAQIKRMLADKRASALVNSFAMRWLNVDDLDAVTPDSELFPAFYRTGVDLKGAFSTEMQMFLTEVLLQNRNVLELLSADYTYVNGNLATHYGIGGVQGAGFRRVTLTDPNRFGLLGKGAVLLRTSYPDRTSPVLRGAWVLEKLLNTMTSPPPPGVETNLSPVEGAKPTTLRGRLEVHRAAKSCNQCHGVIDPIGLAMENFDVIGAYRTKDSGIDVDASTVMPTGKAITGVTGLRETLLANPDQFVQTVVQKLLMYGTGREVEPSDMPQVRQIVREVKAGGNHFFDLVMGVAKSDAFKMQGQPHTESAKPKATTVAAAK
jgi:mono/diheme cytochrome c family protein